MPSTLRGRDVFAHRAAITDPAGQPRMVIGLQRAVFLGLPLASRHRPASAATETSCRKSRPWSG